MALGDGGLSMATTLVAGAEADVPVSFGYHPYLQLPGAPRQEWQLTLPVRRRALLDERGIPTGQSEPAGESRARWVGARSTTCSTSSRSRRDCGLAAAGRSLTVSFDEGYHFAQVYAPDGQRLRLLRAHDRAHERPGQR